jgi:DHA1 family multidrug resistance protein-like MFS transporter
VTPWKKTVYASFVAQVLSILGFACALPFLPLYIKEDLGITDPGEVERWAGLVLGAAGLTLGFFGPIWGMVADRFGRKPMVLRSMFGGAAILMLMSFTQTVQQLLVCRLLQGVVTGTVTASTALVASAAPRERAGFAMGMMQSAVAVGISVGPLIGGVVSDLVSHRAAFRVAAVMLLMGGVLVKVAVREQFTRPESSAREHQGSFGEVLAAVGFLAAVFALFATRFANSVPNPIFPLFVETLRGTAERLNTVTGALLATYGVAAAVASAFFGRYGDAWGHKRMLIAGCAFTALAAVLHALAQNVAHLFVFRVLLGLGAGAVMPSAASIIRTVTHDKNIGKAYGVTTTFTSAAWALGPLAGGYLAASIGAVYPGMRYRAPFLLMALALVVAALIVRWRVRDGEPNASH